MICRMLWPPSGNVMVVRQPVNMTESQFRAYIDACLSEGATCYPDDPPPLVEWEHDG